MTERPSRLLTRRIALVAEDHEIYRMGLANVLDRRFGFSKVLQAASLDEAVRILGDTEELDFATFDLIMPGMHGAASLGGIRQACPKLLTIVVSASERREDMISAILAGAHGYAAKSMDTDELVDAIETVLSGRVFLPWSVTQIAAVRDGDREPLPAIPDRILPKLTARQQDVLKLLRCKRSNKQIARELGLTENTVKVHTVSLYRALGVRGRADVAVDEALAT